MTSMEDHHSSSCVCKCFYCWNHGCLSQLVLAEQNWNQPMELTMIQLGSFCDFELHVFLWSRGFYNYTRSHEYFESNLWPLVVHLEIFYAMLIIWDQWIVSKSYTIVVMWIVVFNDGTSKEMLCLDGTVPVIYKGSYWWRICNSLYYIFVSYFVIY